MHDLLFAVQVLGALTGALAGTAIHVIFFLHIAKHLEDNGLTAQDSSSYGGVISEIRRYYRNDGPWKRQLAIILPVLLFLFVLGIVCMFLLLRR